MVIKGKDLFGFIMMFVMPILLWMYIFKSFLNGSIAFTVDSYSNYSIFKFFYNNLFNGVVPVWDPFVVLGVPCVYTSASGVLSPLMALFACLHFLGINYYASFILFILFYFILGLAGFYLLALKVLEDRFCAWLAFIALLFSGMAPMLFNQLEIYFVFCPVVWLFYFLFCFADRFEPKYFLGIIIALTNIFCFYYPFYFLTLILFFIVFLILIYPVVLINFGKGLKGFIVQHKKIFFGCILFIVFALLPLILFKVSLNGGDILFLCRRDSSKDIVLSENALNKDSDSAMTFNEVSLGGTLGERMKGGRLFSHLDKYEYGSDDFFYIPVFIYITILITSFVSFGRRQFFILCLGLSIFLLSLGQAAPLHRILFDNIFYFKYFRNLFFFMAFLIPLAILFAMFQLKELLRSSLDHEKRWRNVLINTFLHFYFLCFLYWQGNILITTYATVVISCVLFNLLFFKPKSFKILFFLIMVLEPIQVFASFEAHSSDFKFSVPAQHVTPLFTYERTVLKQDISQQREGYVDFLYDLLMRDSSGHIPNRPLVVSKFAYILSKTINENVFLNYVRHKFYIYDRVIPLKDHSNLGLEEEFRQNENSAFISRNTEQFKVVDFNPNRIQLITNFKTGKFLVYTDSYEKYWKVFINRQEQKLYRANMAFKGVWLPAGKNEVVFQYSVMGEEELYVAILFLNSLFLIYFLGEICIKRS